MKTGKLQGHVRMGRNPEAVRFQDRLRIGLLTTLLAICGNLQASETPNRVQQSSDDKSQKPPWLSDLSVTIKEGYDNNLLLVSGQGINEQGSWYNTISPRVAINFLPWLGKQTVLQVLSFGYAPDFVNYQEDSNESYMAQRFATALKGKLEAFSFSLDNNFAYIDGSNLGPTYPGRDANRSSFATAAPRERRLQFQDRALATFRYDGNKWFLRPLASLLYYDLMTELKPDVGYQNYVDRYDANGGADFGYKVITNLAVTLGYRVGHQYQQELPSRIDKKQYSATSDYQRCLLGLEGKPFRWLTLSIQGGADFRDYEPNTATHTTPMDDLNPIKPYGEANLQIIPGEKDAVSFKYKGWQWVSSTGKIPYFESAYELTYKRKLSKALSGEVGGRIGTADYNGGNISACLRDDVMYTLSAGLIYALNTHLSFSLTYAYDLGRNGQDNATFAPYRNFDRQLVAFGIQAKF